ncbi:NAD(P)H-binding protein [Paenibacillus monticola]|uniref:NAD(P)H-binding protein n=1 Tax=Paenibacillus monticola TaxID=2666075 RepID=A0A7X2H5I8_9BACL|nr:NAD(P)H-binding protein [Paenibacillus monticola]MRN53969.1 NAD(P)H-binding protein [Paenibacillus monticola]
MIIITGANGQLGRAVVEELLRTVPAEQIGASVRDPEKAQELKAQGVRVRRGDFTDADSLLHAFEGASKVFIVSTDNVGEIAVQQRGTAIAMAKQAGADRIVYTSHMGSSLTSHFPPMVAHAAIENVLQASGMAHTSLRNGFYANSAIMMLGNALQTGVLAAPMDGPVAWTSHPDLAQAAAALLSNQSLEGITPNLTAAEAIDLEEIAAIASELAGRSIRRIVVPDDEYRANLVARGVPEARADMLMGLFRASRAGEFSDADPIMLAHLIGHPPLTFRDFLKAWIAQHPQ